MTRVLHIVNRSPTEGNSLATCLRLARPGDAVLMIEDGVCAALGGTALASRMAARAAELEFYVLGPDIVARGLADQALIGGVEQVDYQGFVELVAKCGLTQSW
jgi:tRNA 2-thiouridine synthesizing protein B